MEDDADAVEEMIRSARPEDPSADYNPGLVILRARGLVAKARGPAFSFYQIIIASIDPSLSASERLSQGMLPKGRGDRLQ
jgi:hypothetical protein